MVKIYLNNEGMESIMKSDKISSMEQNIMMNKLDQVRAAFLQEFGFEGNFEIKSVTTTGSFHTTTWHGGRTSYRIVAADSKTTAALKRQPRWLDKFIH